MHSDDLAPEAAGALAVLHARYSDDVHKHVRKLLGDERAAEAVTRAVFSRARKELAQGGRVPLSLRSWVLSIAQQEALRSRDDASPRPAEPQADVAAPAASTGADGLSRPWNFASGPPSPAATAERPPRAAAPKGRPSSAVACPNLGFADDPANRYSRPTRMHRCFVTGYGASLSTEEQRSLCLTAGFAACPRLGGARSETTVTAEAEPEDAAATAAAESAGPATQTAEPAKVVPRSEPAADARPVRSKTNRHRESPSARTHAAPEPPASEFRARIKIWDLSPRESSRAETAVLDERPPIVMPAPSVSPVSETAPPVPPPVIEVQPSNLVPPLVTNAPPDPTPLVEEVRTTAIPADQPARAPEGRAVETRRSRQRGQTPQLASVQEPSAFSRIAARVAINVAMALRRLAASSASLLRGAAALCWAVLKWLARGSAILLRAAVTIARAALAELILELRSTGAQLVSMWNALGPAPTGSVENLADSSRAASDVREAIPAPGPAAPRVLARPPGASVDPAHADGDPVRQALAVLEGQGLAVTGIVRDQRGMRVKAIIGGQATTRWYSYDECAQLVERHAAEQAAAETEPQHVAVKVKRRARPPIWLSVLVVAGSFALVAGWAAQAGGVLELLR